MSEIKAAIFDVGGVLSDEGLQAMLDDMKTSLSIDDSILQEIFEVQIPLIGSGKIDEVEFWDQVSTTYGTRKVDVSENLLGRAYAESLQPQVDVLKLVKVIGDAGIKLAILSNTIEQHAQPLRVAGIYDDFNHVFLSHEIGFRKPNPKAYEYALSELDITAPEAVFIDDRLENIEAANQLGIHGLLFTSADQLLVDFQTLFPELDFSK